MTCFDMDYLKNWHVEAAYSNLIQLLSGLPLTFGTYPGIARTVCPVKKWTMSAFI